MAVSDRLQLYTDSLAGPASDAGINFVEDEGTYSGFGFPMPGIRAGSMWRPVSLNRRLQRQHHARHLTTGGDLLHGMQRFASIGGDEIAGLIKALGLQCGLIFVGRNHHLAAVL